MTKTDCTLLRRSILTHVFTFVKKQPIHRLAEKRPRRERKKNEISILLKPASRIATRIEDRRARARENHFHDSRLCHGLDVFQCWFRDLELFQSSARTNSPGFREFRRSARAANYALTGFHGSQVSPAVRNRLNRNPIKLNIHLAFRSRRTMTESNLIRTFPIATLGSNHSQQAWAIMNNYSPEYHWHVICVLLLLWKQCSQKEVLWSRTKSTSPLDLFFYFQSLIDLGVTPETRKCFQHKWHKISIHAEILKQKKKISSTNLHRNFYQKKIL